ncbi:MAG: GNAT family N-acetyltransferase [Nocardioides sp.]
MTAFLRDAGPADAADVARVYVESWNAGFVPLFPTRTLTDRDIERWSGDLASTSTRWRVATADGAVVGFAGTGPSRDPVQPRLGELDTIAVDPGRWRQGLGRLLMTDAVGALARDFESAVLWTLRDYPDGHAFYLSTGWVRDPATRDRGRQVAFRMTNLR